MDDVVLSKYVAIALPWTRIMERYLWQARFGRYQGITQKRSRANGECENGKHTGEHQRRGVCANGSGSTNSGAGLTDSAKGGPTLGGRVIEGIAKKTVAEFSANLAKLL